MSPRHNLNAILSPESYAGWQEFAAVHGASMTALAEAMGGAFAELAARPGRLTPLMRQVAADARRITVERKARGKR